MQIPMRLLLIPLGFVAAVFLAPSLSWAASSSVTLSGRVIGGDGYTVLLVLKDGQTSSVSLSDSGSFAFKKLKPTTLKDASLQLVDPNGRYFGPVVLGTSGTKASISFSGKALTAKSFALGAVSLKAGFATLRKNQLKKTIFSVPRIPTVQGRPLGAGELGLARATSTSALRLRAPGFAFASNQNPGLDGDRDGVPNAYDVDDDGDLVLDSSDPDSAGQDIPYTGFNADFRRTLNAHVRSGLTDAAIDAVVSGENVFALTFFISLPREETRIDGGHVICDDALTYCRRNTPLGFYGGIVESTTEFRNRPWRELLTSDGYPRMEQVNVSGGRSIVASIQPRVSRAIFRPGDVYRLNLTQGSTVISSRSLALAPYFVSVPALRSYNAGSGEVSVDYNSLTADSGSIPGLPGNPIVLSADGTLSLSFWRPQRAAIRTDESGYYDWGNLKYGVVIEALQATCAGLYSRLSDDLFEVPNALGTGGSPLANQGATLSPLRDRTGDRLANPANTLSFAVNLRECITRAGGSAGTHTVNLRVSGEPVTGGEVSAVQTFSVQVP